MATLKDIARSIAAAHNMKEREADKFVTAIVDTILEGLASDRIVKIKGFGTFKLTAVRDRESVNVNTGERVLISGHDKISFTPENSIRDLINKPFAQFETVVLSDSFDADAEIELDEYAMEEPVIEEPVVEEPVADEPAVEEPVEEVPDTKVEEQVAIVEKKVSQVEEKVCAVEEKVAEVVQKTAAVEELVSVVEEQVISVEEKVAVVEYKVATVEEKISAVGKKTFAMAGGTAVETNNMPETTTGTTSDNMADNTVENMADNTSENIIEEEKEERTPDMEEVYDDEEKKTVSLFTCIVSNVVVAILAFAAGFFFYGFLNTGKPTIDEEYIATDSTMTTTVKKVEEKAYSSKTESDSVKPENRAEEKAEEATAVKHDEPTVAKAVEKPAANTEEKKPVKPEPQVITSKYDEDVRVRTGAYNIIGVEKTVTVSQGQTLKSISKAYLGPDMECYIEVLNGVKEVKPGDKLKIPKLQLKKKNKK